MRQLLHPSLHFGVLFSPLTLSSSSALHRPRSSENSPILFRFNHLYYLRFFSFAAIRLG